MRSSRQITPSSTANDDAEPSIDPGILAFGTSVSVNDGLRRSIQAEVEDMDKSCSKIMNHVKSEEKIRDELRKSRALAVKESRSILEGATENVEVLNMDKHILLGLENTLLTEISQADASEVAKPHPNADNTDVEGGSSSENLPPRFGLSVDELQKMHPSMVNELESTRDSLWASGKDLHDLLVEKNTSIDAAAEMRNSIDSEKFSERLAQLVEKIQYGEADKESDVKRGNALLASRTSIEGRIQAAEKAEHGLVRWLLLHLNSILLDKTTSQLLGFPALLFASVGGGEASEKTRVYK
jgi:hypothetical protein